MGLLHQLIVYTLLPLYLKYRGTHGATDTNVPGTSSSQTTTPIYNPVTPPGLCEYNFTGPSDNVFIIDRSASFNKNNFQDAKDFAKDLISSSFYVKEGRTHVAVFTFASNVTKAFDLVSEGTGPIPPECEFFLPGGLWENVAYNGNDMHGENLADAMDLAWRAFETSPRKDNMAVSKRLWIMTDFHEISTDLKIERFSGVDIYGYSAGQYTDHNKFIHVIGQQKAKCNYRKKADWVEAKATFVTADKTELERVSVTNTALCGTKCSKGCTCYEFLSSSAQDDLKCTTGDGLITTESVDTYEEMGLTIIIAASVSAACLIILIVIVVTVCLCFRKAKSQPTPIPTLTRPQGTNTDTMSTVATDASTYTNSTLLQPGNTISTYKTTSTGATNTTNGGVNTVSQSVEGDPFYANGDLGKILMEHGIVQDTMTRTKAKDTQGDSTTQNIPPAPVHGKLYKKNPGAKSPDGHCGRSGPQWGHNRNVSDLSNISATPSYIVPIPDDQSIAGSVGAYKYSYPYLHMSGRRYEAPVEPGTKTPTSTHSYEKFAFPFGHSQSDRDNNNVSNNGGITTELAAKLSKFRKKCDKPQSIKYTDFTDEQSSESPSSSSQGDTVSMRFPHRVLPTNPLEKQKEECPMYVDPEEKQTKRHSAKLGTLKFKNLFYMFSKESSSGQQDTDSISPSNHAYSVPYSTHPGLPNKEISQPFREIM